MEHAVSDIIIMRRRIRRRIKIRTTTVISVNIITIITTAIMI